MFGSVLSYSVQTGEGVISGDDGHRYRFSSRDYLGPDVPRRGARIEFDTIDDRAISVHPASPVTGAQNGAPSAFPAIAAGCGAGCLTYFVLALILVLIVGSGLKAILSPVPGRGSIDFITAVVSISGAAIVGYLVYRAVRNRRR